MEKPHNLQNDQEIMTSKLDQPIIRRKLSHDVRDRLLAKIESGELACGEKMPSEHEIMALYKVGRPAVREALQFLENLGVISISHGERATVCAIDAETILSQIDFTTKKLLNASSENIKHLREARQTFETGVVRLVAARRSNEDLQKLRSILSEMTDNMNNLTVFLQKDQKFHVTLAEITGNPILIAAAKALFRWLSDWAKTILKAPGLEQLTIDEHGLILSAIEKGDPDLAARMVSDHILRINTLYRKLEEEN